VFVGGQVVSPGIVETPQKINLLQAIMQAGGFKLPEAEIRNVVVVRHKSSKRQAYSIDLEASLKGDESKPFYLEPQDVVYVPRTEITKVDQWVDQHINKLMPRPPIYFGVDVD
jgi:polysaccharide export outer membrane protein